MIALIEEEAQFALGKKYVCGVDEVGRGPLAGPVVAACVALEPGQVIDARLLQGVNDSKKISEKKREVLNDLIMENFKYVGVGICDSQTVDKINVLEVSLLAMKRAVDALEILPEQIFVDGTFAIKNCNISQKTVIRGDSKIFCIAAASIVAKVCRDRMMSEISLQYPNYSFDKHKGYGTKLHLERLATFGPCPVHRLTFKPVAAQLK